MPEKELDVLLQEAKEHLRQGDCRSRYERAVACLPKQACCLALMALRISQIQDNKNFKKTLNIAFIRVSQNAMKPEIMVKNISQS